jgi:aflatoxin B1 aldehyde reductase
MAGLKIVFGGGAFISRETFPHPEEVLQALENNGVKNVDTAILYGQSETILGEQHAGERFILDTKSPGGFDSGNALKPEVLKESAYNSLKTLKVKKVDIFYIHAPDSNFKPETWLPTLNELYKDGVFERFGLSNFLPEDVEHIYDLAREKGYVLPTAYQGNYNPLARRQEETLFPLLRKLKIAFYAYSPLAGGYLTKTRKQIEEGAGRFGKNARGEMYRGMYVKPTLLDALEEWEKIAAAEGTTRAELAYRWVNYHSPLKPEQGDAIIFGASSLKQLEETITGLRKGPLKPETVKAIDGVWESVSHEAPLDNYNSHVAIKQGARPQ